MYKHFLSPVFRNDKPKALEHVKPFASALSYSSWHYICIWIHVDCKEKSEKKISFKNLFVRIVRTAFFMNEFHCLSSAFPLPFTVSFNYEIKNCIQFHSHYIPGRRGNPRGKGKRKVQRVKFFMGSLKFLIVQELLFRWECVVNYDRWERIFSHEFIKGPSNYYVLFFGPFWPHVAPPRGLT